MYNINFNDPLLTRGNGASADPEIARLHAEYVQKMQNLQATQTQQGTQTPIWDEIDAEINGLSDIQKKSLSGNEDFMQAANDIQMLVNDEILSLIKPRLEASERGKKALSDQLNLVKRLKRGIIEQTDKELEEFRQWKESKTKK